MSEKKSYPVALFLVTCLFFLWGFAHNLDPILIPHLKKSFTLTTTQSTLVDSAVYIAYFLMALPAGFIIKKFGYKIGIISGLLLFAIGSFLFVPAANFQSYNFFLVALFIIACGLTTLETAANPYANALGDEESATFRLNLVQSFNGLAVVLAPSIGARMILTKGYTDEQLNAMDATARQLALASEASTVKTPYIVLGIVLVVIAIFFAMVHLPKIVNADGHSSSKNIFHALKHSHLRNAVIAQFFYVGAQVSVLSLFILFAKEVVNMNQIKAADLLAICGLAFLIGRFTGTLLMKFFRSQDLLAVYAVINVLLCAFIMITPGMPAVYAVVAVAFFMSIMFPTIFSLGIKDLKGDTEFGSSLLIMSIVGGAIFPRLFGMIADASGNFRLGYLVPLLCFVVVAYFGWRGYKTQSVK